MEFLEWALVEAETYRRAGGRLGHTPQKSGSEIEPFSSFSNELGGLSSTAFT